MTSLGPFLHVSQHHLVQLSQLGLLLGQSPLSALMTSQHSKMLCSHMLLLQLLLLMLIIKVLHT